MTTDEKKLHAAKLLNRYDNMRKELRTLERELNEAAKTYGYAIGLRGWFNKDHLRIRLAQEQESMDA